MHERLKTAVDKALERRNRIGVAPQYGDESQAATLAQESLSVPDIASPVDNWLKLEETDHDRRTLERERIVTRHKTNPAHIVFDNLRTRLLRALDVHKWTRIAVTSPTKGCGKTMVSANLAFSLARQPEVNTMLLDMDLLAPSIARRLGIVERLNIEDLLTGATPADRYLRRIGSNLALGLNHQPVIDSAELMQSKRTAGLLANMLAIYRPRVVIYDLPPMLVSDDVIAFLPNVDAVLMIAAAGHTRPAEISECERIIAEHSNFLGILLNKSFERPSIGGKYEYT